MNRTYALVIGLTILAGCSSESETSNNIEEQRVLVGRGGQSCTFEESRGGAECEDGVQYNCRDVGEGEEQPSYEVYEYSCADSGPEFECYVVGEYEVCSYGENEEEVCDEYNAVACVSDDWAPSCSLGWIGGKLPCPDDAPCVDGRCKPPEAEAELECDREDLNDRRSTCWREYIWSCGAGQEGRFSDCRDLDPDATCFDSTVGPTCVQSLEMDTRCAEGVPGICIGDFQDAPCIDGRLGVVRDCPDAPCQDGACPPFVDN